MNIITSLKLGIAILFISLLSYYKIMYGIASRRADHFEAQYEVQRASYDTLSDLMADSQSLAASISEQLNEERRKAQETENEISKIRQYEQQRALAKPFERGNAHSERIRNNLMRISAGGGQGGEAPDAGAGGSTGEAKPGVVNRGGPDGQ